MPRPKGTPKTGGGPRKPRSRDVAPEVRGAFLRACRFLEDDGEPLSMLIHRALKEDVNATLHAIARFVPKELMVDAHVSQSIVEVLGKFSGADDQQVASEPGSLRR